MGVGQAKQSTGEPSGPTCPGGPHAAWGLQHQQVNYMAVQRQCWAPEKESFPPGVHHLMPHLYARPQAYVSIAV